VGKRVCVTWQRTKGVSEEIPDSNVGAQEKARVGDNFFPTYREQCIGRGLWAGGGGGNPGADKIGGEQW